jgi:hypothetical protein
MLAIPFRPLSRSTRSTILSAAKAKRINYLDGHIRAFAHGKWSRCKREHTSVGAAVVELANTQDLHHVFP